MDINLTKRRKHAVTASDFGVGSTAGVGTIHTVKSPLVWDVTDGTTAWIKFNFYEPLLIDQIVLDFTGTAGTITIEKSYDNFNWIEMSPSFVPSDQFLEIDYSDSHEAVFIRITISNPSGLTFDDIEIHSDETVWNTEFLSHNYLTMFDYNERENYPFFPNVWKNVLEMLDGTNDIDLRTFGSTSFTGSSISGSPAGDTVTFTPTDIPVVPGAKYIWDFDEELLEADSAYDLANNPNIINTTNPLVAQSYTYSQVGLHVARLVMIHPDYILEWTDSFLKV